MTRPLAMRRLSWEDGRKRPAAARSRPICSIARPGGVPVGEASVNAETAPTTAFVTFLPKSMATGVAYANPSTTQSATVTFTVYNAAGTRLASQIITLGPLAHGSANLGPLLGIQSFTGFVKITSTLPIISLSLNAEAFPVFSSLPPGDLPGTTTLLTP